MTKWMESWLRGVAVALAIAAGTAVVVSSPAAAQEQGQAEEAVTPAAEGVVNLNTATAQQLTLLPGIGQSKAEAIVSLRERRGPFQRVEQIMLVRGVGRATFRRLRPMLTLEGPTTLGQR